uniref:(northern house mosquito) hypothetical protein n=1 Tax=Culex pipiens TaxID=7175 RepID=A0A8D8FMK2_CULPI
MQGRPGPLKRPQSPKTRTRRGRTPDRVPPDGLRRRVDPKASQKRYLLLPRVPRGAHQQHALHGGRDQQHLRCNVHNLRPKRHRGPDEGIPRAGQLIPAAARPRIGQGSDQEPRIHLPATGSDRPRVTLPDDGPARIVLPVRANPERVPRRLQAGAVANALEEGEVLICIANGEYTKTLHPRLQISKHKSGAID